MTGRAARMNRIPFFGSLIASIDSEQLGVPNVLYMIHSAELDALCETEGIFACIR
jgi:hypothetical protein